MKSLVTAFTVGLILSSCISRPPIVTETRFTEKLSKRRQCAGQVPDDSILDRTTSSYRTLDIKNGKQNIIETAKFRSEPLTVIVESGGCNESGVKLHVQITRPEQRKRWDVLF